MYTLYQYLVKLKSILVALLLQQRRARTELWTNLLHGFPNGLGDQSHGLMLVMREYSTHILMVYSTNTKHADFKGMVARGYPHDLGNLQTS